MLGANSASIARSYKSLSHLISSGVGLIEGLNVLAPTASPDDRRNIMRLRARLSRGASLADTLRVMRYPRVDVALVAMGEETGTLSNSLRFIGEGYEQRAQLERSIEGASVLPAFLIISSILLKHLPPLVNGFISGSQYLVDTVASLCVFAMITGLGYVFMKHPERYPRASQAAMAVGRKVPKLRNFIRKIDRFRFFSGLYICVRAGCDINKTFYLAKDMTSNPAIRLAAARAPDLIQKVGLAGALQDADIFDVEEMSQIVVGEESGTLELCLKQITDDYKHQLDLAIAKFREWAPRVLYAICFLYVL